jgi:hypothetical protein
VFDERYLDFQANNNVGPEKLPLSQHSLKLASKTAVAKGSFHVAPHDVHAFCQQSGKVVFPIPHKK